MESPFNFGEDMHPKTSEMLELISEFYKSRQRNQWLILPDESFKLYVRKAFHILNGCSYQFLDLASFEVHPDYQNQGIVRDLLTELEKSPLNLNVENVLNENFSKHLDKRHGWMKWGPAGSPPISYARIFKPGNLNA